MPISITMPRLSDTMQEGTLNKWHVKVGDKVKSGDILADVETDKATMELQAFDDGTVAALVTEAGKVAAVGSLILVLATGDEALEDAARSAIAAAGADAKPAGAGAAAAGPTAENALPVEEEGAAPAGGAGEAGSRVRVSPLARKIAQDMGVDVGMLRGTGPDGRIIKRDVLAATGSTPTAAGKHIGAAAAPAATTPVMTPAVLKDEVRPLSNMRKTIARRLVESKTTIPHFTVTVSVNMDPLLTLRQTLNQQLASQGVKLSVNDFLVRAAAVACAQHPVVNSSWTEQGIQYHGSVNVGVAVSLPEEKGGGLVVPVLRNVQNKGLRVINQETKALAEKARGKGLSVEEMAEGTFTISNLGMYGVAHFEAIINPPQAAILAVGAAIPQPVVREGQIVIGQEMTLTLSADHRVIDGASAAEFLQTLKQLLENPAALLV